MATTPAQRSTTKKTTPTQRDAKKTPPARKPAPAKKPPARKPAAKKTPPPLPKRAADFMTDGQGFAIVAARMVGIPTNRIRDWTDHHDGTITRALNDGTLHYTIATRTLRWQATCRMGAIHTYRIDDPGMAVSARMRAANCSLLHADLTNIPALTDAERAELGIGHVQARTLTGPVPGVPEITETIPVPMPGRPDRSLADTLAHSDSSTADTQPLSRDQIAAALTARADAETPKEHPKP